MLKRVFIVILLLPVVLLADAQLRKIPADVTDAFAFRYPHATHVEWKDKLQHFEASFQLNGATVTAAFSSKGEWEGSERIIEFNDLPGAVQDGFAKSKYTAWKKNVVYETQSLGKPLQYRISVQKSGIQKKNLYFDTNGKLFKESIAL